MYEDNNGGGRRERILNPLNGGKRGGGGFEDILRKAWEEFSGGGKPPTDSFRFLFLGFLVLMVLWGIFSSYYTVGIDEQAVVLRFGRHVATTDPGLHFKLPYGIDQEIKLPTKKELQHEFGFAKERRKNPRANYLHESLMLTGDLNVAVIEWTVFFKISDPAKYLFNARDVNKNIRDVSMSIMRRVVGDRLVSEVLTIAREEISTEAKLLTQEVFDRYDMGISITKIVLQSTNPPDSVADAYNEVNSAKQEQEKDIKIAEREYNKVIPEARGKAEKLISDAEAYAVEMVNRAKGDVAQFSSVLKEYRRAPDITRRRLYIETMEEIFSNLEKVIVVDSNVKGVLPLYPTNNLTEPPKPRG